LTGGMAYEALANAGTSGEPMIVVLNDNNMSIDKNVGGMSRHLARLRVSSRYLNTKNAVRKFMMPIPGGKNLLATGSKFKKMIKSVLLPSSMFEQMGFHYLGPVDGHDLEALDEHLKLALRLKEPVLIHIMTQKGKGYEPAEKAPEKYHGVTKFDPVTGISEKSSGKSFSAVFGEEMLRLAKNDSRICAVSAAMPSGTGLSNFAAEYPERFFDVGIAEEHAVAMTAGMAKQGLKPVCALYSTFLQRGYDQLIHDLAIEGTIPAVFAIDRAGIVGADGATHNGVFDVAFLRSIPNMRLFAPSNYAELRSMMTQTLYRSDAPSAIRYPRGGEGSFREDTSDKRYKMLMDGTDAVIISYGIMINKALEAAAILQQKNISTCVCKLNELTAPFEAELLEQIGQFKTAVVLEDVVQSGSVGEALAAALMQNCHSGVKVHLRNTGDRFLPHGSINEIERLCGIDADSVAKAVLEDIT
jgi:1-deoxy-D-xylulose-5-phosphate synthase